MWNILISPASGNNKAKRVGKQISAFMKKSLYEYQVYFCERDSHFKNTASELCAKGETDFILVGSTQSLHYFVAGAELDKIRVGIIPIGRANDMANVLSPSKKPITALKEILDGGTTKVDLIQVNDTLAISHVNFGADAVALSKYLERKRSSKLRYAFQLFRAIWSAGEINIDATINGQSEKINALQISLINAKDYGFGIKHNPLCSLTDNVINMHILPPKTKWEKIKYFTKLLIGRHIYDHTIVQKWVNEFECEFNSSTMINIDGELIHSASIKVVSLPSKLNVLMTPKKDFSLPRKKDKKIENINNEKVNDKADEIIPD